MLKKIKEKFKCSYHRMQAGKFQTNFSKHTDKSWEHLGIKSIYWPGNAPGNPGKPPVGPSWWLCSCYNPFFNLDLNNIPGKKKKEMYHQSSSAKTW